MRKEDGKFIAADINEVLNREKVQDRKEDPEEQAKVTNQLYLS